MATYNELTCLFGHHDYDDVPTADKYGGLLVQLCKICKRSGYNSSFCGDEAWHDFDERGNRIHTRWGVGLEAWYNYDGEGRLIHTKYSSGSGEWKDNDGCWVNTKPKNWKYEKQIQ